MRFLIDAQLPPRLVKTFLDLGREATHVAEAGLLSASDQRIWQEAISQSAVLITKDQDFAVLRVSRAGGSQIVWLRVGNVTNDELIARFTAVLGNIVKAVERGEALVEVIA